MQQADPRTRLLDAVVDHLAAHGSTELSLRALAAAVGTSHRMLIYHFGDRENLLAEVVRTAEARQRQAFATLHEDPAADPVDVVRRMWEQVTDPALRPLVRITFQLAERVPGTDFVDSWLPPLAQLARELGVPAADAEDEARLWLAVTRGLLLDLLVTGDRDAAERAATRFFARYPVH